MSGNLVQRGEFAVYEKFRRTETALDNGADLVIELPCVYSLMSAQGFAKNAVAILEATGAVDRIAFGAECDSVERLYALAKEIDEKDADIAEEMSKGLTYPAARKAVIGSPLLDYPNNILALEYIRYTKLPCVSVERIGKGHDTDDEEYSAAAIRAKLVSDEICTLKNCENAVLSKLRQMSREDFARIEDVTEGLENRIYDAVRTACTLDELYDSIKTKRYTHSRIRRIILKAYLNITKDYITSPPYIRILGFNDRGRELLSEMKKHATLPVISKYGDISSLDENGKRLLELECACTDLYNLGYKKPLPCGTEQRSQIIIKQNCTNQ
jgi:predicted nucleotidyltransferase